MNVQAIIQSASAAPVGALPPLPADLDQEELEVLCGSKAADRHDEGRSASDAGSVGAIEALAHVLRLLDHLGAEAR